MMKKILFFLASLMWLGLKTTFSQSPINRLSKESKLSIRNAFEAPDDKADPAKASFTLPDTGKNSYLINIGITYDIVWNIFHPGQRIEGFQLSPFAVFNKNTLISSEQFNYKTGVAFQYMFGRGNGDPTVNPNLYADVHFINTTLQYLHNFTDTAHSILLTSYWSWLKGSVTNPNGHIFLNAYHRAIGKSLFYNLAPSGGLEMQDIFKAKGSPTGFQGRVYFNTDGRFAWRHPTKQQRTNGVTNGYAWPKILELSVSYTGRVNIINSLDGSDRYIPLFTPSLTYYPLLDDNLSLALSYSSGADPVAGLAQQHFWQLAVQFKL